MGYYLDDHPNTNLRQQRPRRERERGIIGVHTAESFPDEIPPDTGAENVARFISDRSNYGSYHAVCDSDSIVLMVRDTWCAFHIGVADLNDWSYGISAATQARKWDNLSPDWINDTVTNMARAAADYAVGLEKREGITIPARRISRSEALDGKPGHIAHGDADPGRRTDPGPNFPWHDYLARYEMFVRNGEAMALDRNQTFDAVIKNDRMDAPRGYKGTWQVESAIQGIHYLSRRAFEEIRKSMPYASPYLRDLRAEEKKTLNRSLRHIAEWAEHFAEGARSNAGTAATESAATRIAVAKLAGRFDGLEAAIKQLAENHGTPIDMAAIAEAAENGTRAAMVALDATVTLELEATPGNETETAVEE